jgi:hypothetical protein
MEPSQPLSRAESPPRCPICLEYHSADTAILVPCGHTYDVACLAVQLKILSEQSRQCPVCRNKLACVKYAFTPNGDFKIHIPGRGDQDADPFLRDDEVVPPGASEGERKRKMELRRLRTVENFLQSFSVTYRDDCTVEDNTLISISQNLHLTTSQAVDEDGVGACCTLKRTFKLVTRKIKGPEEVPFPLSVPSEWSPEELFEARKFIRLRLDGIDISKPWSTIRVSEPKYIIFCDDRGLMAVVVRTLDVARRVGSEDITIQETVSIVEEFFPKPLAQEESAEDVVHGIGKAEREKALKMARQELQGVMEIFLKVPALAAVWKELDRGGTGILEAVVEEDLECQYCDERHRNGDCRLPNLEEMEINSDGDGESGEDKDSEEGE